MDREQSKVSDHAVMFPGKIIAEMEFVSSQTAPSQTEIFGNKRVAKKN